MHAPATPIEWVRRCASRMRDLWPEMDVMDDMLLERARDILEQPHFKRLGPDDAAELQCRVER